jgi:hypothetical protein
LLPLIEPKSILALTATAGPMVIRDICNTLCIPYNGADDCSPLPTTLDDGGVKVLNCDRDNIDVFPLLLQSIDERRYLVSFSNAQSVFPVFLSYSHWVDGCLFIVAQNFEREE